MAERSIATDCKSVIPHHGSNPCGPTFKISEDLDENVELVQR
jgi:hypothetical protein